MSRPAGPTARSIEDFGEQWTRFTENPGYYGSVELLRDIVGPLLDLGSIRGARVAEVGSGTGRIVLMLAAAGAGHVCAVEPSDAFAVLRENTAQLGDRVTCVQAPGEGLPGERVFDLVVAIGVLHHIPDPDPVVRRAFEALKPGGRILVWLYGREGNEAYLALATPLRAVARRLPDRLLVALCRALDVPLRAYISMCRVWSRAPMARYVRDHLGRLDDYARRLTIYDQLNPAWAKYYRKPEAEALLARAGFSRVRSYHRHGYSWTVTGERPT